MRMTKEQAKQVQAEHIEWYGKAWGVEHVRAVVMAADTSAELADGEHDIKDLDRHIPRGAAIEALIPEILDREKSIRDVHSARLDADAPIEAGASGGAPSGPGATGPTPEPRAKTMTVVFEIKDHEAFNRDLPGLAEMLMAGHADEGAPYRVIGLSVADEIRRSNLVAESLERHRRSLGDHFDFAEEIEEISLLAEPEEFDAFRFYEDGKPVEPGHDAAEDAIDSRIAAQRLEEIESGKASVLRGDALERRLGSLAGTAGECAPNDRQQVGRPAEKAQPKHGAGTGDAKA